MNEKRRLQDMKYLHRCLGTEDGRGNLSRPSLDQLKELRTLLRLTTAQLAARVGVENRIAIAWERGNLEPFPPERIKLRTLLTEELKNAHPENNT